MKRIALALIAVAMTGALAYAEDAPVVKVNGYVDSGIKAVSTDNSAFETTSYANDYGAAGTWGKISVSVDTATYGAKATAQASDKAAGSIADAFVWYSPAAGLVVDAGTTYSKTSFDGLDDTSNDYFWSNGFGATYTVSGLSVGARLSPNDDNSPSYGFGAAYDLSKVGAIHASVQTTGANLGNYEVSANVTAIDKLSLNGGYIATALNTDAVKWADVSVSYAVTDALSVGVTAYDQITAEYFTVQPNASYVVVPGVTVSGYYQYYTDKQADVDGKLGAENEVKAKISLAAGAGTLGAWTVYDVAAKKTTIQADYVLSF